MTAIATLPPFAPWLIRRKDNGLFDLYGTVDHHGKPWRRPQILAMDVDPSVAAWAADSGIANPSFTEAIAIWRAETDLDGGSAEKRRDVLSAVIAGLERRNVPGSMIVYLKKKFEECMGGELESYLEDNVDGDAFLNLQWRVEGMTPCGLREVARFAVEPDAWKYGSSLLMARLYYGDEFRGEYRGPAFPSGKPGGGTWYIDRSNDDEAASDVLEWRVEGVTVAGWMPVARFAVEPHALKYGSSLFRARVYPDTEFRAEWRGSIRGHHENAWYDRKLPDYDPEPEEKS